MSTSACCALAIASLPAGGANATLAAFSRRNALQRLGADLRGHAPALLCWQTLGDSALVVLSA
ncbi:hypothetical protein HNP33_002425 [Comamonas odontotermitis]|uniref:Uncharacterized protein n=1 Tax=Comamonas odontotermitis TaxID=379895 RepID=A0ABR6RGQ9_9BURK|nr:hypothetical protein [Comamonas odontotermitis]